MIDKKSYWIQANTANHGVDVIIGLRPVVNNITGGLILQIFPNGMLQKSTPCFVASAVLGPRTWKTSPEVVRE